MVRILPKSIRELDQRYGGPGSTRAYVMKRLEDPVSIADVAREMRVAPATLRYWLDHVWPREPEGGEEVRA